MAEVYLGRADGPGGFAKPVALKLVLPHLVEEPKFVRQFEHEARIAAILNHPNIAQVFEFGADAGELFIAMEFIDGHTLRTLLNSADGPLPLDVALSIMVGCCGALEHAHHATNASGEPLGLVHRDISPSNVMVRNDGLTKVVDFGIAKAMSETHMTRSGSLKGKAGYMSPEQCLGRELTPVSDIFNLGILLYESTLGVRCFSGSNIFDSMQRISDGKLRRPTKQDANYPPELEAIVLRALATDPADRTGSAAQLQHDVEAFASGRGVVLSDRPVREWMERVMGPVRPLDLDVTMPYVRDKPSARPRLPGWARTTLVGGLAGTLAFVALRSAQSEEEPRPSGTPAAEVTRSPVAEAPTQPPPTVPLEAPVVVVEPGTTASEAPKETPVAAVGAEEASQPGAGADERKTKPRPRKKSRPRRKKKSKKRATSEPLFPWKEK